MERNIKIHVITAMSPFGDLSNEPLINPITYELSNLHVWHDGIYIFPNIFGIGYSVSMIVEVLDKKVINVYKNIN